MSREFKVGDRVAVYSSKKRFKGTVTSDVITSAGLIQIKFDDGYLWDFFPQQCRRLIKKQRRRVWVHKEVIDNEDISDDVTFDFNQIKINQYDWIEFIKVKKP